MKPTDKHPLQTYFEAKGYLRRKPYIFIILGLFVFTILTQMAGLQQLKAAGVNVEEAKNVIMPLWVNIVLLCATASAIPAVIMRARDSGLPPQIFGGLFALNILLGLVQMLTGNALPEILTQAIGFMNFIAVLALMFRPSSVAHD